MITELFIIILGILGLALAIQNVNQNETIKSNKIRIKQLEGYVEDLTEKYFDVIGHNWEPPLKEAEEKDIESAYKGDN